MFVSLLLLLVCAASSRAPLTVEEAAEYLGVTPRWVRSAIERRRVPFHKLGHLIRFKPEDLDEFLAKNRIEAEA